MTESIYICLENTLKDGLAELAADHIRMALKAAYQGQEFLVEISKVRSYTDEERENIPLTILRRTAADAKERKASLGARVVPMVMGSPVSWNVCTPHSMLFITTVAADGTGDWIGTPVNLDAEPHDSFIKILERLDEIDDEIRSLVAEGPAAIKLSRLIVGALQCGSFAQKH